MNRKCTYWIAGLAIGLTTLVGTGCEKLKARDQLNKGVQAYRNAKYPEAVERFKTAVQLDPQFPTARLYLATAYMMQYIPGADSTENQQMAKAAHDEFLKVLEQDTKNVVAITSIASLFFQEKKFDEAEEWNRRLIAADPKNRDAYYTLGVIAWTRAFQADAEARAKLGMKPEDPGPLKDKKVREALRDKHLAMIEDGIKNLEKALQIDSEFDDAMAYTNLLWRQKADLEDTPEGFRRDSEIADSWIQKTLETKKAKTARMPGGQITAEPAK
jgi:tetratricopeptide (TPR) repeat protein